MFNNKSNKLFPVLFLITLLSIALFQSSFGNFRVVNDNITELSDIYESAIGDLPGIEKGKQTFFPRGDLIPVLHLKKQYANNFLFLFRDRCNIRTTYKYPPWSKSTFS